MQEAAAPVTVAGASGPPARRTVRLKLRVCRLLQAVPLLDSEQRWPDPLHGPTCRAARRLGNRPYSVQGQPQERGSTFYLCGTLQYIRPSGIPHPWRAGPIAAARPHFASLGHAVPENVNIADAVLDLVIRSSPTEVHLGAPHELQTQRPIPRDSGGTPCCMLPCSRHAAAAAGTPQHGMRR